MYAFLLILCIYYIDSLYSYLSPGSNDLGYSIIPIRSGRKVSLMILYPWHLAQYVKHSRHSLIKWINIWGCKTGWNAIVPNCPFKQKMNVYPLYFLPIWILQPGISAAFLPEAILLSNLSFEGRFYSDLMLVLKAFKI